MTNIPEFIYIGALCEGCNYKINDNDDWCPNCGTITEYNIDNQNKEPTVSKKEYVKAYEELQREDMKAPPETPLSLFELSRKKGFELKKIRVKTEDIQEFSDSIEDAMSDITKEPAYVMDMATGEKTYLDKGKTPVKMSDLKSSWNSKGYQVTMNDSYFSDSDNIDLEKDKPYTPKNENKDNITISKKEYTELLLEKFGDKDILPIPGFHMGGSLPRKPNLKALPYLRGGARLDKNKVPEAQAIFDNLPDAVTERKPPKKQNEIEDHIMRKYGHKIDMKSMKKGDIIVINEMRRSTVDRKVDKTTLKQSPKERADELPDNLTRRLELFYPKIKTTAHEDWDLIPDEISSNHNEVNKKLSELLAKERADKSSKYKTYKALVIGFDIGVILGVILGGIF